MRINRLKRREFIAALGGAAVAWPHSARAQQRAMPTVGVSLDGFTERLCAFRQGLKDTGHVEGENLGLVVSPIPAAREVKCQRS
jgi:putative tryptophan/tyrosine transport system substrate-binding protein